jgi:phosphatidylglycerophosphate synthase
MTTPPSSRLQVLVRARPGAPLVAGLPCAVRAAYRAGGLSPERIVVAGADQAYLDRWSFQLRAAKAPVQGDRFGSGALDPRLPLLAVDADAFPDVDGLAVFLRDASEGGRARLSANGRALAAFVRDAAEFGAGTAAPADVHARLLAATLPEAPGAAFFDAARPALAAAAADALYARMSKPNDGYLARFDRRVSVSITRLMLPFPVSPNQVTAASLALGFLGAWWLAAASAGTQFAGALLLWFCAILDGCDGEIARLKHHITEWGGDFDLLADHVAHLATFIALPVGVARLHPEQDWRLPGVLLVTGFLAAGYSVWRLVLRVPEEKRGPTALVVERVASRDYVYLIVALTAVGRLDWFVWTAAYGSHAFWLWLWWSARRAPAAVEPV